MAAQILPARPDVDTGKLEPREQRHGTDLILRVVLGDTPAVTVIELQHFLIASLAQIVERQMPPKVGAHERVQVRPSIRRVLQETRSLVDLAARQVHVRQRMLRPWFLAQHGERGARLGFGFAQ